MTEIIAALVSGILVLLGLVYYKTNKLKVQKQKTEEETAKKEILQKQMETVYEVKKELSLIDDEEKPQKAEPIESGDANTRLEHLNKLSDSKGKSSK